MLPSNQCRMKRRIDHDVIRLIEGKHEVTILSGLNDLRVQFRGPEGSAYADGVWQISVHLTEHYPFQEPKIAFVNRIFHPNIDEWGAVCLDVINQAWTPLYDLTNIFECFLPQLLIYPNPKDPMNCKAAAMYLQNPEKYRRKVLECVRKYASPRNTVGSCDILASNQRHAAMNCGSDSSMSDLSDEESN